MSVLANPIALLKEDAGVIPEGFIFLSYKNIGNQPATVMGLPVAPGEADSFPFVGKGYPAIAYDATGTTLKIRYVL